MRHAPSLPPFSLRPQEVMAARRAGSLGSLNPLPYPAIFANCCLWASYGMLKGDSFLFWSNTQGLVLGCFFTLSSLQLADAAGRRLLERAFTGSVAVLVFVALLVSFPLRGNSKQAEHFLGGCCTTGALLFYGMPLSSAWDVVRTKSAASLSLPLCLASLCNASAWGLYGVSLGDPALMIPNVPGIIFTLLQLYLIHKFGRGQAAAPAEDGVELLARPGGESPSPSERPPADVEVGGVAALASSATLTVAKQRGGETSPPPMREGIPVAGNARRSLGGRDQH